MNGRLPMKKQELWTIPQLLEQYPGIEEADVLACIAYGAEMSRERC